jgi:hypothetical protein
MDFVLHNIKEFLDVILLIFHTQETCKSTTHTPGLHPTSLIMTSVPSYNGPIFITTALLQQTKMKGDVLNNLSSAGSIIHSMLLTKFSVTGCYQLPPRALRIKSAHNNQHGWR